MEVVPARLDITLLGKDVTVIPFSLLAWLYICVNNLWQLAYVMETLLLFFLDTRTLIQFYISNPVSKLILFSGIPMTTTVL